MARKPPLGEADTACSIGIDRTTIECMTQHTKSRPPVSTIPSTTSKLTIPSVDDIRAQFPAVRRKHNGYQVAYFDGPGGTQVPQSVADAVSDYLLNHNANTHWT